MDIILKYFPNLSDKQKEQFETLKPLYEEWNAQINVISRKDLDDFYQRHVLHALGIAKVIAFKPETEIMDVGTGGGFPGIPLSILFPEAKFYLVDSIGKKIKVVEDVVERLGLRNVTAEHQRAEEVNGTFDFVISRAVTHAERFVPWVQKKIKKKSINGKANGFFFLKGGDLHEEFAPLQRYFEIYDLKKFFEESF